MTHKIKIGLTGGIASGKTTISSYAEKKGIKVIDADKVAREVLQKYPEILEYLKDEYEDTIFDNNVLNRKKLGKIIFSDSKRKKEYEKVIMPFIIKDIKADIKEFENGSENFLILDAALLFEESLNKEMDFNILVYADVETQIKRILKRDNLSEDLAEKRIKSQMDVNEKKSKSDFIIDNSGDVKDSFYQFDKIIKEIISRKKV